MVEISFEGKVTKLLAVNYACPPVFLSPAGKTFGREITKVGCESNLYCGSCGNETMKQFTRQKEISRVCKLVQPMAGIHH